MDARPAAQTPASVSTAVITSTCSIIPATPARTTASSALKLAALPVKSGIWYLLTEPARCPTSTAASTTQLPSPARAVM